MFIHDGLFLGFSMKKEAKVRRRMIIKNEMKACEKNIYIKKMK
jgi:hypothetical protein